MRDLVAIGGSGGWLELPVAYHEGRDSRIDSLKLLLIIYERYSAPDKRQLLASACLSSRCEAVSPAWPPSDARPPQT